MRNRQKDAIRMGRIREQMMDEGFRMFAEKGIDAVNMRDIAEACNVGIATLYRYFRVKTDLVLAIGVREWVKFAEKAREIRKDMNTDGMTAADELAVYLDFYTDLYANHRDLLRFNQSFNNYVRNEGVSKEQLKPYLTTISEFAQYFHGVYEKGKQDGTLRTDMPEDKMFASTMHIMIAVGVRFAQGLLYDGDSEKDRTEEYELLKQMILKEFVVKS